MKFKILLLFIIFSIPSFAQIRVSGRPFGLKNAVNFQSIPEVNIQKLNTEILLQEDEIELQNGIKTWRFGSELPISFNSVNDGLWQLLPSGEKMWQLKINCANATSLNFIFNQFQIPEGGRFYVYSPDGSLIEGAFTSQNHNPDGNFATMPILGNSAILEYNGPEGFKLQTEYIIRGYRDFNKMAKAFGTSGACNVNVNCPEGAPWDDEIRSAVMLLTANNTRFCSGALMNNTTNDFTPYILTANHCGVATTNIFMFNYQSPNCTPNQNGPTNNTLQGCVRVANNQGSDFALARLNNAIPEDFDAYFSGWSRQTAVPDSAVCIHHPDGDVKKITFNNNTTAIGNYLNADCWHVLDWELGTTEPGSSGSALYNEKHQVIGQLYGGTANCSNNVDDFFGRFVTSWSSTQANRRLRDWLDPLNKDTMELNGLNANGPKPDFDLRMVEIKVPEIENCELNAVSPQIVVRNNGNLPINAFDIGYSLNNGNTQNFAWTGTLNPSNLVTIDLSSINLTIANAQNLSVFSSNPNGQTDERPADDTLQKTFNNKLGKRYNLRIIADNYPEETGFQLRNSNNQILYSLTAGNLPSGTSNFNLCLTKGCYTLRVTDVYGDGLCCNGGQGSFTLFNDLNSVVGTGSSFTFERLVNFCVDTVLSANAIINDNLNVSLYPNPAKDAVTLTFDQNHKSASVEVYGLNGQLIHRFSPIESNESLDIRNLSNGLYLFKIILGEQIVHKRVSVVK